MIRQTVPVTLVAADQADASTRRPPEAPWLKQRLMGDMLSAAITLVAALLVFHVARASLEWGLLKSVWPGAGSAACQAAEGGACWAFIGDKFRQILFGIYPPGEQWRAAAASLLIVLLSLATLPTRHWTRWLALGWALGLSISLGLMGGGVFGLAEVPTSAWGGLPVTLLLAVCSLGAGLPLGIMLALARRSTMPVARVLSVVFIEVIRGLPLVSLLFIASILLPLMLPDGMTLDSLLRAAAALTLFSAAYLAEVVRGGLQAVSVGQREAAQALGLSWWHGTRLVVLPQALRYVIAPLTNTAIVMIKNTSLVLIVGLFDLLSSGRAALTDPAWPTPYAETYLFIAGIYFVICFGLSRYSLWLEGRFQRSRGGA